MPADAFGTKGSEFNVKPVSITLEKRQSTGSDLRDHKR
jgi:hypothetical protein